MIINKDYFLLNRPVAHRGLHDGNVVPENGYEAYRRAIELNYPIEMDVQMTADGVLVCFHDDNLKRMTGVDKDIRNCEYAAIHALKLNNTEEHIPLFREFLSFVNGRVPLVIEIKQQINKGVEEKVISELKGYKGEYVIQSFDPFIVRKIRKLDKTVVTGQLATGKYNFGKLKNFVLKNMLLNLIVKPDFINYDLNYLPIKPSKHKNRPLICWTIRNENDKEKAEKYADNYIFENLRP